MSVTAAAPDPGTVYPYILRHFAHDGCGQASLVPSPEAHGHAVTSRTPIESYAV